MQLPSVNRLNADQQPAPFGRMPIQPRPLTAAERLQSQSFADGLGQRLLKMIGIGAGNEAGDNNRPAGSENQPTDDKRPAQGSSPLDETMRALQNSSVLQQLNRGLNSVYGGLSKMYNSTVQGQLKLLQERFKMETSNSSNPWQERMAQRVPNFFKQMTDRVVQAQEQLNKVWRDVNNGSLAGSAQPQPQQRSFFNQFDQFVGEAGDNVGGFFDQMGRSFGFNQPPPPPGANGQPQQQHWTAAVRDFWNQQVAPQVGMVRSQMARVWRDLTQSGALMPEAMIRARDQNNNLGASSSSSSNNSDLVDNLLKEIDMGGPEYALVEPRGEGQPVEGESQIQRAPEQPPAMNKQSLTRMLSPQMQNGLISAQRELNQLWMGLTSSLQGAIKNVRQTLNPRPQFVRLDQAQQQVDPAQNEIDGKLKDLGKLQRDADMVYETVQQQQHDNQQRQTFGDRFRNFFNQVDFNSMDEIPHRIGDSVSRFGTAVNDLWNQIPERWDNWMHSMRPPPQPELNGRLRSTTTTTTTTTTESPSET